MKGLIKDPSAFLRGKKYAKHLYEFVFNFYLGEKNEYLAYINIYAILVPKCLYSFINDIVRLDMFLNKSL
jgi:hypothetical protein